MNSLKELAELPVKPGRIPTCMDFRNADSLATRASLLERLKDLEDQDGWREFYQTYRKLIFSFALQHGLTGTEAEEVVQETVITVARNLPEFRYDPQRCAFKTWLLNLTLWRIQDQLRKRRPGVQFIERGPGESDGPAADSLAGPELGPFAELWQEEWKKHLFERALEHVKTQVEERQFQIFDLYALQDWPAREVARSLGVSLSRVYVVKHRISALLRKAIQRLEMAD
jgi:RNA polymerase sigma factor (sigma-70 family)